MRRTAFAVVAAALLATPAAAQNLTVAPTNLEVGVGRNAKTSLRVTNQGEKPREVRVEMRKPTASDREKARPGKPEWARWAPKHFTLPPDSGQTVRVLVATPRDKEPGTYRIRLFVRDVSGGERRKIDKQMGVKMRVNLSLPIIVTVPQR